MEIPESSNFIQDIIVNDLQTGKRDHVLTRFPPEPNGYIHIGHAKSICLNFGTAKKFGGFTNLRFDDTNPTKEDVEYVDSIREDVKWLGFEWKEEFFASDYYDLPRPQRRREHEALPRNARRQVCRRREVPPCQGGPL